MKNPRTYFSTGTMLRLVLALAIAFALSARAVAQTPGGTTISNQASASYSDGTNTYNTVSNTVTVTVSNVSGLTITPDAGSNPTIVAGQTGVLYNFTVTNTGNFSDQVHFLAGGASAQVVGPGTITREVIDLDNSGTINAGDTDLMVGAIDSALIAQNASIHVLVEVSVNGGAPAGQTVQVVLGDAGGSSPFDNQPVAAPNTHEVRTVLGGSVNGLREAKGDISASVVNDALLQLTLTSAPAGPVDLGTDITYTWTLTNNGLRPVGSVTLNGLPQVYIIAPIPQQNPLGSRGVLKTGQVFPAGTLYTTSPLGTAPLSATWTSAAPSPLTLATRVAFPVGVSGSLAAGATSAPINMIVTVPLGIDASAQMDEIGDAFGTNSVGGSISDQSGDATSNNTDGNANFNEGYSAGPGHGVI